MPNLESMLAAGLERGLTSNDANMLTAGMWIDYIIEYNNMHCEDKYKVKYANQRDFDNF